MEDTLSVIWRHLLKLSTTLVCLTATKVSPYLLFKLSALGPLFQVVISKINIRRPVQIWSMSWHSQLQAHITCLMLTLEFTTALTSQGLRIHSPSVNINWDIRVALLLSSFSIHKLLYRPLSGCGFPVVFVPSIITVKPFPTCIMTPLWTPNFAKPCNRLLPGC